jgi:NADH dehydrogenase FAD-containing subunit
MENETIRNELNNMKTIIILGGGVGGVITANTLRKKTGREHKIIVIGKILFEKMFLSKWF